MLKRLNKLSFKLPFLTLTASLLPLLILGQLAITYSTRALIEAQYHSSHRTAVQEAKVIDEKLEAQLASLENAVENLNISELDPFDLEWALLTILKQHPEIVQTYFINPQGQEIAKVAVDQTFTQKDLLNHSEHSLFKTAAAGEKIISPATSLKDGGYHVDLFLPLVNVATGSLSGVLVTTFTPHQLLDNITQTIIGAAGQVYVIDQKGKIIAHRDQSKVLAKEVVTFSERLSTQRENGHEENSAIYRNINDTEVLGVFADVRSTAWRVVVERPLGEINASSNQIRQLLLTLFIVVFVLVVIITMFFIRRIAAPLKILEQRANAIGSGDMTEEIIVNSKDEIGQVATAFNLMRQGLIDFSAQDAQQKWLQDNLTDLQNEIREETDLWVLARKASTFLAKALEVPVAALYVRDFSNENLHFSAGFAFLPDQKNTVVVPGAGVLGQAVLERKIVELKNLPENYLNVVSGLGQSGPVALLIAPLIHNGQLAGLIEFGSFQPFEERHKELLNLVSMPLAVAIAKVQSTHELACAFQESQKAREELQTQQEELRVANEELEDQAQQLKASEEMLRNQQEELQVANEELEEKTHSLDEQRQDLAHKNLELQNTQIHLEQKSVEVERSSRYKSEFLANMSHELRTPLNSLLILSQDLANNNQGNLFPDQVEAAEIVYNSGNDLLKLINEILDLSKIESGKMALAVANVPLTDIVSRLENNFCHLAKEHQIDFEVCCADAAPETIRTDPARLDQILKNLTSNALKFTEKGHVTISIDPAPSQEGAISIAVTDTGIGIAPENLDGIFNAFQQIDGSISRKFSGTGLGLSISRELTKLLGGKLQVSSQIGIGSTFTLILPPYNDSIKTEEAPATVTATPPPHQITKPTKAEVARPSIKDQRDELQTEDKSILIIEDDLKFAKILADLCRKRGFKFLHAGDGESGLELIEKYLPDAIILDMRLPGIQGIEVLDVIKGNPDIRHIPVHIMTASENTGEVFAHGAIGFMQKPITQEQLDQAFNKLEEVVSGKIRNLLIIEDDPDQQKSIQTLIGNGDTKTIVAGTGEQALQILATEQIECIILDLNLPDMTGLQLLQQLDLQSQLLRPAVIVYSAQELTRDEVEELNEYTLSIIIKGAEAPARLLDEASLFLHRVVGNLPKQKQKMIHELYDQEQFLQNKKILLVDDDMRNVFAIAKILEDKGAQVLKAANGQKALDLLATGDDVGLVLMDIMMPVMDGFEAIKQIRAQEQFANLPIIALTAKAMEEDRKKCIAAGANDYLSKPVNITRLLSLSRVWLQRK